MTKQLVKQERFDSLHSAGLKKHLEWLSQLTSFAKVEKIADFGCESSEPFALMWTLDATEIKVIEKEESHLSPPDDLGPRDELGLLRKRMPLALEGRRVEFLVADMSIKIDALPSEYFDLAYCEDVLYCIYIESGLRKVQEAINEMVRVVKPGGWTVAVEPKIGADFEEFPVELLGDMPTLIPINNGDDISLLFEATGMKRYNLDDAPNGSYCYRKPLTGIDH